MLEAYAIGVDFQMKSNATSMVDRMITEMERLSGVVTQTRERVAGIAGSFRELRSAASSVEALTRALERMNRAGQGGGSGGGRGGRGPGGAAGGAGGGWNPASRAALADARYFDANFNQLRNNERKLAELENAAFDRRRANDRRMAELENQAFDRRQRAAERAVRTRFDNDYSEASRENRFMDQQRRAVERADRRNRVDRTHAWGQFGMGGQMVGGAALHGAESALERGIEVEHLRTQILADRRVTPDQANTMVMRAYDATASAPGTKVSENLHALIDLKNVTGSLDDAEAMLPRFAQLTALLKVMDKRRGGDGAFAAAKAMEVMGGMMEDKTGPNGETVHEINPQLLQKRLDYMARVSVATNSRVAPQDYLGFAKQARVAGMTLSDEFIYEKLPAIMMATGGQRAGTGLMSTMQVFRGGMMTPKTMEALMKIGLAGPGGITMETNPYTGKPRQKVHSEAVYDTDMLRDDPLAWVQAASKRMDAKGIHGSSAQVEAIMKATQRSTISGLFADLLKDAPAILKEQENIRNTRPDVAAHFAANDPAAKMQQVQAAFDKFMTTLGTAAMSDAVHLMDAAVSGLNKMGEWATAHPTMARLLVDTALGLGAVGTALGALSTAIFLFGPALKLLGVVGGAATAGGTATVATALGGVSLGGALAAGSAAAVVGGAVALGNTVEPRQAQSLLELQAREQRRDPMRAPSDGFGVDGRPLPPIIINIENKVEGKVNGSTLMEFVSSGIARYLAGPNGGTTSFDPKAGAHGGLAAIP